MAEPTQVIVIGAASLDVKGRSKQALVPVTSNPGEIHFSPGGEARNIAENLARLGVRTTLLSAVGQDTTGSILLQRSAEAGVDISQVIVGPEHHSASYLVVLDESGSPAFSIDDMQVLELIRPQYIAKNWPRIKEAAMVFMDANLAPRTIESVLKATERYHVPAGISTVSVSLAPRLKPFLSRFAILTANAAEAEAIVDHPIRGREEALAATQQLITAGVGTAVITLAELGLCYATSQESGYISALKCDVVDYTGAGAALTAAVIYGLVNAFPVAEAMRLGVSAAALTLKCPDTVCTEMGLDLLYDQLIV
jgi:pseudouridine kinase